MSQLRVELISTIASCYENFECRLRDTRMIRTHGLFIWEVVRAHVAVSAKRPRTIHYRGDGEFMISGEALNRRRKFRTLGGWGSPTISRRGRRGSELEERR